MTETGDQVEPLLMVYCPGPVGGAGESVDGNAEEGVGVGIGDAVGADAGDDVADERAGIVGIRDVYRDGVESRCVGGGENEQELMTKTEAYS